MKVGTVLKHPAALKIKTIGKDGLKMYAYYSMMRKGITYDQIAFNSINKIQSSLLSKAAGSFLMAKATVFFKNITKLIKK